MEAIQVNIFGFLAGFATVVAAFALYKLRVVNAAVKLELEKIHNDILSTNSGSIGIGKRLLEVEKKMNLTLNKQDEYQQGYTPYTMATEMLGTGADVNAVIKNCGISRAEAELMQLMHRQMKRYGPTHK